MKNINKKELNENDLKNVNGGMKIFIFDRPKIFDPILRLIFKIKN